MTIDSKLDFIHEQLQRQLIRESSFHLKLSYIKYYETIAIIEKDNLHAARATFHLAMFWSNEGSLNKSSVLLKKIIPQFQQWNDNDFLCKALSCLAKNKWRQGNIEEALMYYNKATKQNNITNITLANLQIIQTDLLILFRDYTAAIAICKNFIAKLSMHKVLERTIYTSYLLKLSELYSLAKEHPKALKILKDLKQIKHLTKCKNLAAQMQKAYGLYYINLQEYPKARHHLKKARKGKSALPSFLCRVMIAETYLAQNKLYKAEHLLLEISKTYKQNDKETYLRLLSNLVSIYQTRGNKISQEQFEAELALNEV